MLKIIRRDKLIPFLICLRYKNQFNKGEYEMRLKRYLGIASISLVFVL